MLATFVFCISFMLVLAARCLSILSNEITVLLLLVTLIATISSSYLTSEENMGSEFSKYDKLKESSKIRRSKIQKMVRIVDRMIISIKDLKSHFYTRAYIILE